ncbi:hypothetical protein tpqmel_0219 [Candidatus Gastranaerophilus sp. (ex Termes propinquus)]|nr:hypothetical protein tpqmel_0219 [Candidatus Gastranaerophilus sp. (ex Termes propinquus)]
MIAFDPTSALAYYYRGICNFELEDFMSSIEDYSKAIELQGDFAKAYYNRGTSKFHLTLVEDAIADIKTAQDIFKKQNDSEAVKKCAESLDELSEALK